jgi:hypothetical protein
LSSSQPKEQLGGRPAKTRNETKGGVDVAMTEKLPVVVEGETAYEEVPDPGRGGRRKFPDAVEKLPASSAAGRSTAGDEKVHARLVAV